MWLVPSEEDSAKLRRIMTNSKSVSGSYPKFEPHVTLATFSTLDPQQLRESIPKSGLSDLRIQFKSVDIGTHFFRSVYIAVEPSSALTALHTHIHQALNMEPRTPSFPHISLCYIVDDDAARGERQAWRDQLEATGRIRSSDNGVELNCGIDVDEDWMACSLAHEIWLVNCVGPVEEWSILDRVLLN